MAEQTKQSEPIMLLTDADRAFLDAFTKAADAHVARVTVSKEAALQELVDAGIADPDGQLNKRYRHVA